MSGSAAGSVASVTLISTRRKKKMAKVGARPWRPISSAHAAIGYLSRCARVRLESRQGFDIPCVPVGPSLLGADGCRRAVAIERVVDDLVLLDGQPGERPFCGLLLARHTPRPFAAHLENSTRAEDAIEGRLENVVAGSDPVEVVEDRREERLVGDRFERVGGGRAME